MTDWLVWLLRLAGAGLILLAIVHIPMARHLKWGEEARRMSLTNASIFHVHTFFICVVLVLMGAPALLAPQIFLDRSPAGLWCSGSCTRARCGEANGRKRSCTWRFRLSGWR